ncbi:MAG: 60S ribosomal export protein NMD3 [Thermoplasmata archaeon]
MKCIICNKREAKIDGMCEVCFLDRKNYILPPKKIEFISCPNCGSIKIKNSWYNKISFNDGVRKYIENDTKIIDDRTNVDFDYEINENKELIKIIYKLSFSGYVKNEEYEIPFLKKFQMCPKCSRQSGDYFESIIQVRSYKMEDEKNIKNFIYSVIEKEMSRNPDLFVLKEEKNGDGFDIYLSSNSSSKIIVKKISEEYGASIKESPQLAGVKNGKKFYRVTYSVRFPEYGEGDYIKSGENRYKILAIRKGQIKVQNILTGEIGSITQKDINDKGYTVFSRKGDEIDGILLYENNDELVILDLMSYKTLTAKKPGFKVEKELKIVQDGENVFVIK